MSVGLPSTMCPPRLAFCVLVCIPLLFPPPQASSSSMPPARKVVKATLPPMPRRKSRLDHAFRKRSNSSKVLSGAFFCPTSNPPVRVLFSSLTTRPVNPALCMLVAEHVKSRDQQASDGDRNSTPNPSSSQRWFPQGQAAGRERSAPPRAAAVPGGGGGGG